MNSLGIYFGIKDINLVETSGRRILNNIRLPYPNQSPAGLEESVPAEVKLIALLKDAFRTYRINAQEAVFSISGLDLVIRTFEIPLLPQSELRGAVNFEAKKYIPFKLEDLDYDFQVFLNKKNKTSLILLVGIKKEILNNYIALAKELNLKVNVLEYSAFSVLRFLKLANFRDSGVMANLCFDLNNNDEANFTVFENGFSLFSRDFTLVEGPVGFEQTAEEDFIKKYDKLKNEIRVSLDFYNRKFPDKNIKNIFVIANKESHKELDSFFSEVAIPIKFVDTQKILGKGVEYSSMAVKGFAASLFKLAPLNIKINLVGARLKTAKAPITVGLAPLNLLEGLKLDLKFVFLGIILCLAVFGYGLMRVQPIQDELVKIKNKRVSAQSVDAAANYEDMFAVSSKYKKKIALLDNLVNGHAYATYLLDSVPQALPKGTWLNDFKFSQKNDGALELILSGQVYLGDSDKEFESVNIFLTNLKNDRKFSSYFKDIAIRSIDRKIEPDRSMAVFEIVCQKFPEKE